MKDQIAFFVSLASAHFRAGYIRAWGLNWYVNLEQVFDMKANRGGIAVRDFVQQEVAARPSEQLLQQDL